MEVKIGVQHATREIVIDSAEDAAAVEKAVADALSSGGLLTLVDSRQRRVIIPADRLTFVEIGNPSAGHVGFRS